MSEKIKNIMSLLYNNIGAKIKAFAFANFIFNVVASIAGGIIIIAENSDNTPGGLAVIFGGILISLFPTWFIYGFGELIENSKK